MFSVLLETPLPDRSLHRRALAELSHVVASQATLRAGDLETRRAVLERTQAGRQRQRGIDADLTRLTARVAGLEAIQRDPRRVAAVQLEKLLRLVGGMVEVIEIGAGRFAARVAIENRAYKVRVMLLPEPNRAARIQMQPYEATPPAEIVPARQPCLGVHGNGFVDIALDGVDLWTLVLSLVAYLRTN